MNALPKRSGGLIVSTLVSALYFFLVTRTVEDLFFPVPVGTCATPLVGFVLLGLFPASLGLVFLSVADLRRLHGAASNSLSGIERGTLRIRLCCNTFASLVTWWLAVSVLM